ncbi:cysteine-rich CWC family protein [Undibacterium sp. SXout11W]|uniref:cysteine-rich CWC family protein n=1 Tax=Undibacterium sp. SXout11W TaxID=3413050 RepID=UPI003BF2665D
MSICQRCQQEFTCAVADKSEQPCWCMVVPAMDLSLLPDAKIKADATCLCPRCLPVWKSELINAKSKV